MYVCSSTYNKLHCLAIVYTLYMALSAWTCTCRVQLYGSAQFYGMCKLEHIGCFASFSSPLLTLITYLNLLTHSNFFPMHIYIYTFSYVIHMLSLLGDVIIPGDVTLTVDSDIRASHQFSLTCISTGGPATTVTWARDSTTAMGDEMTVLDNATTAQYTHTLTVTGRLGGLYQCTVSNAKPSSDSASLTVQGTLLALCDATIMYVTSHQLPQLPLT